MIAHAFFQTDEGGWSWDIPERCEDDSPDLERARKPEQQKPPPEVPET
jgi:hypothetical protein